MRFGIRRSSVRGIACLHLLVQVATASLLITSSAIYALGRESCDLNGNGIWGTNSCSGGFPDYDPPILLPPLFHDSLPDPLWVQLRPDLNSSSLYTSIGEDLNSNTLSAWVHVPPGGAVNVFSTLQMSTGNIVQFGVGETSVLGDRASIALNLTPKMLPKYFGFFTISSGPDQYEIRTIGLGDAATRDFNGVEWLHVTGNWTITGPTIFAGGTFQSLDLFAPGISMSP